MSIRVHCPWPPSEDPCPYEGLRVTDPQDRERVLILRLPGMDLPVRFLVPAGEVVALSGGAEVEGWEEFTDQPLAVGRVP